MNSSCSDFPLFFHATKTKFWFDDYTHFIQKVVHKPLVFKYADVSYIEYKKLYDENFGSPKHVMLAGVGCSRI